MNYRRINQSDPSPIIAVRYDDGTYGAYDRKAGSVIATYPSRRTAFLEIDILNGRDIW